jgi:hypothetical protein
MVDVTTVNTPMDQGQPSQQQISALDTSSLSSSVTSTLTPLPAGPASSQEIVTDSVHPPEVVEQATMMDSKVTCKQCGQSCPIYVFSPSQLRKWKSNSVCRSCLVDIEVPHDTPALLENPFLAPNMVVPDPRFILADNSDPLAQRLPARPVDSAAIDPDLRHTSLNKWMVAQRADSILKHIIDFIANGKVDKGTTLTAIRKRSLPYSIDRGVLMRRATYRKEEISTVVVPFVFQEFF